MKGTEWQNTVCIYKDLASQRSKRRETPNIDSLKRTQHPEHRKCLGTAELHVHGTSCGGGRPQLLADSARFTGSGLAGCRMPLLGVAKPVSERKSYVTYLINEYTNGHNTLLTCLLATTESVSLSLRPGMYAFMRGLMFYSVFEFLVLGGGRRSAGPSLVTSANARTAEFLDHPRCP